MRKKSKPLGMAAAVLMAVLALAGQAWAMYLTDGAVETAPGVYANPSDGVCVLGLGLPGTANAGELDVDPTISNQKDCIVATNPTIKALSQTACNGGAGNDGYRHTWATSVCVDGSGNPISRAGVDNTAAMCTSKGGTATGALCVAYGWQYMGAKASEVPYRDTINPVPADYKGRTDADDRGFCYTSMRMTSVPYTVLTCPSENNLSLVCAGGVNAGLTCTLATAATACPGSTCVLNAGWSWGTDNAFFCTGGTNIGLSCNPASQAADCPGTGGGTCSTNGPYQDQATYDAGLGWSFASSQCLYAYSVQGYLNAALTDAAGSTATVPLCGGGTGLANIGTCVDLTAITTQGECLAAGASWDNWLPKLTGVAPGAAATAVATSPVASTIMKLDATTPIADGGGKFYSGTGSSCLKCHSDMSRSYMERYKAYYVETGHKKAGDNADFATVGDEWGLKGVQCEICHATGKPTRQDIAGLIVYPNRTGANSGEPRAASGHTQLEFGSHVTGTCFYCHGTAAVPDTDNPAAVIPVAGGDFAPTAKNLAPIANQFLNSPHANYGGTSKTVDIITKSNYDSTFVGYNCRNSADGSSYFTTVYRLGEEQEIPFLDSTTNTACTNAGDGSATSGALGVWQLEGELGGTSNGVAWEASKQGNCTTCHDVHWSLGSTNPKAEPIRRECTTCHVNPGISASSAPQVAIATINHPVGVDTPLENVGTHPYEACGICHMPKSSATGSAMHLWRVNPSGAYTTMGAGQANLDGGGAAWVDVDLSCGQCHGGSAGPVFTKAEMAAGALAMHAGGSATNADCLVCHATGVGGAPVITPGTNHHGLHSTCVGCHPTGHNATLPDQTSNAFCLNCHTNTGAHAVHHAVAGLTVSGSPVTCQGCHTIPGVTVPPMTTRDQITAGCLSCHISGQGANAAIYPRVGTPDASQTQDNHHRGSSTLHFVTTTNNYGCKGCHGNGASTATATGLTGAAFCGECHTVTQGTDHHVGVCLTCHRADGAFTGTYGAGVTAGPSPELNTSCLTCHATPQGTAGAISSDLTAMKHGTGGGTPASFTNACATCHKAPAVIVPAVPYVSFPGVAPVVDASCGQCHGGSAGAGATTNGAMYLDLAYLTSWAAGMHQAATTLPPTPGYSGLTTTLLAVSFTDNSTDNNGKAQNTLAISINWGDGQVSSGAGGAVFSHTYAYGGAYNVIHKATDSGGRMKSEFISVKVSSAAGSVVKRTLTVTVLDNATGAYVQKATVYLKKAKGTGFAQVRYGRTNASGQITFTKLADGVNFKIVVYKTGLDFDGTKKGRQTQAKSDAFLMDMDRTVQVEQGVAATNGPVSAPWKGTDGGVTVFTVAP